MPTDIEAFRNADWRALLATARSRNRLAHSGKSGAPIDRVELASGATVVVKRCSQSVDLVAKVMRDEGRVLKLWATGVFDRMPPSLDHALLAVLPEDDGWLIVMRDVAESFVPDDHVLTLDQVHTTLSAVDAMHQSFLGEHIDGVCPLEDYLRVYLPVPPEIVPGWTAVQEAHWNEFKANAAPDMVDLLARARLDSPTFFARLFEQCEQTLVHGDLFPPNIGFLDDRLVLVDWSFATIAPAAFEIAFFLLWSDCGWCATLDVSRESLLEGYQTIAGRRCDAASLSIGLISAFALSGTALRNRPEALKWWTHRIRTELSRATLP